MFGTKAGMMSYFTEEGLCVPATVIALEEGNIVTAIKTDETDGYNAVQVGHRRQLGHFAASGFAHNPSPSPTRRLGTRWWPSAR